MKFGNRLKLLRNEKGLTQLELAKTINLSKANVSKYEANQIEPNFDTLLLLSQTFGVSVDYLLCKTDVKNADTTETVSEDDIKVALFGGAEDVTDEMWQEAKAFAEYIKDRERRKKES